MDERRWPNGSIVRTAPPHGTRSCYASGCRRAECIAANTAYQQVYRRRVAWDQHVRSGRFTQLSLTDDPSVR